MQVETFLARARSALNKRTKYESPGKVPALGASTWPSKGARIDCSGYVAWCLRILREVQHPLYMKINGGWFETTAIHADGLASVGYFSKLDDPAPGAMLVYPDYVASDGTGHDGHVGIVLEVNGKGIPGVTQVIHCSLGESASKGDAIQVTSPEPWIGHDSSIIVWRDDLER